MINEPKARPARTILSRLILQGHREVGMAKRIRADVVKVVDLICRPRWATYLLLAGAWLVPLAFGQELTFDADAVLSLDEEWSGRTLYVVDGDVGPTTLEFASGQISSSTANVSGRSTFRQTGGSLLQTTVNLADSARFEVVGGVGVDATIAAYNSSHVAINFPALDAANGEYEVTLNDDATASLENVKADLVPLGSGDISIASSAIMIPGPKRFVGSSMDVRASTLTPRSGSLVFMGSANLVARNVDWLGSLNLSGASTAFISDSKIAYRFGEGSLGLRDHTSATVSDTTLLGSAYLLESSELTLNNVEFSSERGSVWLRHNSIARLHDGVLPGITAWHDSTFVVSGTARVGGINAFSSSIVEIQAGEIGEIAAEGSAAIEIKGGMIQGPVSLSGNSVLSVFGDDLAYDSGVLTGRLLDGTQISTPISVAGNGRLLFNEPLVTPVGQAAFNAANGHFYEVVWLDESLPVEAFSIARGRSLSGIPGHLATITSQEEADFVKDLTQEKLMFGRILDVELRIAASDFEEEGVWRWADGPEVGEVFYRRDSDDEVPYAEWGPGSYEPNDFSDGEDFAFINYLGNYRWNDIAGNNSQSTKGLLVEYSVMPGDVNIDGVVDLLDFSILKTNFGRDDSLRIEGDLNIDGVVDLEDFVQLKENFGATGGPTLDWYDQPLVFDQVQAVPEPSAWILALVLAIGLPRGWLSRNC